MLITEQAMSDATLICKRLIESGAKPEIIARELLTWAGCEFGNSFDDFFSPSGLWADGISYITVGPDGRVVGWSKKPHSAQLPDRWTCYDLSAVVLKRIPMASAPSQHWWETAIWARDQARRAFSVAGIGEKVSGVYTIAQVEQSIRNGAQLVFELLTIEECREIVKSLTGDLDQ
jgi:hypothetical protein